jgi:cytochrome P450
MNLSFKPAITPEQARRCHEAVGELDAYPRALIRERRSQPCEDILSVLISAEVDGDRLTEAEIIGNTALLLSAGYETTMGLIRNGTLSLLRSPVARLGQHPELAPKTRSRNSCVTSPRCSSRRASLASTSRSAVEGSLPASTA